MELIECIPNVSEGRNTSVIEALKHAICSVKGVNLLNVDSNVAANRTVFTFCGSSVNVIAAAKILISEASQTIDMTNHTGEHPRIGAVDVCPFVPISGITVEQLAKMVNAFALDIAEQLGIPTYLYEHNAKHGYRKRLEQIRKGEYENLQQKLLLPEWKPDYGPTNFNRTFGALIIGTRNFLVAYNINLATKDVNIAKKIAGKIRESGYKKATKNAPNTTTPGLFKNVKAIGWYIADFQCAQVSTNITDIETVKIYDVFECVKKLAEKMGVAVTGSEIIGLLPYQVLFEAGLYYSSLSQKDMLQTAIKRLNLSDTKPFSIENQVLEIKVGIMQYP